MKLIGKETQRKIELQIETLQKRVVELEGQLALATSGQKKAEQELKNSQASAAKQLAASQEQITQAKQDAAKLNEAVVTTKTQLSEKAKELDIKSKEAAAAQTLASKTQQEFDSAKKSLVEAKSQLVANTKELEAKVKELTLSQESLAKTKKELDASNKSLADTKVQLGALAKDLETKSKELVAKIKEHSESKAANEKVIQERDARNKELSEIKAQLATKLKELDAKTKDLGASQSLLEKVNKETDITQKKLTDLQAKLEASNKEQAVMKAELDKNAKLAKQLEAKHQDSSQENELLLLQLMQAQEELVEYYEQKGEFEKLYQAYKARWDRLEKRLPTYLDFGAVDIVEVDGVSDTPSITWKVKDFAQAGVALSEFSFVTLLQDGNPGIGLIKEGKPYAFVPKLLSSNKDQLAIFLGLGTSEYKQLTAAASILEQLETGQWAGFEFPAQFDLSFWRPSIKALLLQLKQLPALLRYDEVRLKRELINPDYEHLWLELHGLSLGASHWKKFEIRLGAALVQADGFSQYPKFEIPLIDGKTKPFESWYAESQDDSGAKLELRFALDKNVFDVAVWAKLSDADKALVMRVIYAMPEALSRLEKQKTAIHRPWATWIDFAAGAIKVLEANKATAKLTSKPAESATPSAAEVTPQAKAQSNTAAPQGKLVSPVKLTNTGAKAGKVISITSKPVAKPKPKAATKPTAKTISKTTTKTARKA